MIGSAQVFESRTRGEPQPGCGSGGHLNCTCRARQGALDVQFRSPKRLNPSSIKLKASWVQDRPERTSARAARMPRSGLRADLGGALLGHHIEGLPPRPRHEPTALSACKHGPSENSSPKRSFASQSMHSCVNTAIWHGCTHIYVGRCGTDPLYMGTPTGRICGALLSEYGGWPNCYNIVCIDVLYVKPLVHKVIMYDSLAYKTSWAPWLRGTHMAV